MPWTYYTDSVGRGWKIDKLGLWILVRQNVFNRALRQRSHYKRVSHILGPNEVSVETDFDGAAKERDELSSTFFASLERECILNGTQALHHLIDIRNETEHSVQQVRHMQRHASREMSQNIEQSVHRGEIGVAVATQFRDLSATTLVVGSAFMTGGASLAVLGGGSVLRGVASYEDRGNVGAAMLTTTGTFVVGVIPLAGGTLKAGAAVTARVGGEAINYAERGVLVVVGSSLDAQFQACNALIEGRSGRDALRAAAARFTVDLLSAGVGTGLDRWALPVISRLAIDSTVAMAGDFAVERLSSPHTPAKSTSSMPVPVNPAVCDAHAVLSTGNCSPQDWVRQVVLQAA